jgi:hypothetical protein
MAHHMTTNQGEAMQFIERRPVFQAQQNFGQQSAQELFFLSGATSFTVDGIMADVVLNYEGAQSITVKYGEWLVKDPAGNLSVVGQADMKSKYEQVK